MDKQEARVLFKEADRLYKSGNYIEALQHLSELENEFSEDFNVLYPMLLCREQLGRLKEARDQCNSMMDRYTNAKQRSKLCEVYARLLDQEIDPQANKNQMPGNEFIKDEPYVIEIDGSGMIEIGGRWIPWRSILLGFLCTAAIFTFIVLLPFLFPKNENGSFVGGSLTVLLMELFLQYVLNCVIFYIALWTTNSLLHDDVILDIIEVCIFAPFFVLFTNSPMLILWIAGWIVASILLVWRYNMGLMDLFSFIAVFLIVNMAFTHLLLPAIFS